MYNKYSKSKRIILKKKPIGWQKGAKGTGGGGERIQGTKEGGGLPALCG